MTTITTATRDNHSAPAPPEPPSRDVYDSDDVLGNGTPPMKSVKPRCTPEPSPAPDMPPAQVSPAPSASERIKSRANGCHKNHIAVGDTVLVAYLGNNRHAGLTRDILKGDLPADDASDPGDLTDSTGSPGIVSPATHTEAASDSLDLMSLATSALAFTSTRTEADGAPATSPDVVSDISQTNADRSSESVAGAAPSGVPGVAAGAGLGITSVEMKEPDGSGLLEAAERRDGQQEGATNLSSRWVQGLPFREERSILIPPPRAPYSPNEVYSPSQGPPSATTPSRLSEVNSLTSPTSLSGRGELPPLQMPSPRSDPNGHGRLPSIKALTQLGDLSLNRHPDAGAAHDNASSGVHSPDFSRSPPGGFPRLSSISSSRTSPPISPSDMHRHDMSSPARSIPAISPFFYSPNGTGSFYRPGGDYAGVGPEVPAPSRGPPSYGSGHSFSAEHLSSFVGTSQSGPFVCKVNGCSAPPFQTQYLLNSHANVHSSARPHYCPVPGCPRSEGGKGFKRKNEMIRHGLVHDSPGYVCPFCPDREHKYPRPDNLQRYADSFP